MANDIRCWKHVETIPLYILYSSQNIHQYSSIFSNIHQYSSIFQYIPCTHMSDTCLLSPPCDARTSLERALTTHDPQVRTELSTTPGKQLEPAAGRTPNHSFTLSWTKKRVKIGNQHTITSLTTILFFSFTWQADRLAMQQRKSFSGFPTNIFFVVLCCFILCFP